MPARKEISEVIDQSTNIVVNLVKNTFSESQEETERENTQAFSETTSDCGKDSI